MAVRALILVAACCAAPPVVADAAIFNGDFEAGDLGAWRLGAMQPGAAASIVPFDVFGDDGPSLAFRMDVTDVAPALPDALAGAVSQFLHTELIAGVEYQVVWEHAAHNAGPDDILHTGIVEMYMGNRPLHRWTQGVLRAGTVDGHRESVRFVPTETGIHEIGVVFRRLTGPFGGSSAFLYVDNVRIIPPNPLTGDTNGDWRVTLDDLNNVRNHFGATGPADGTLLGDAWPPDGVVDMSDLNAVRNHFGQTVSPAGVVPEPTAWAIALLGAALLACRRR